MMGVYVFGNCTEDVFLRVGRLPRDGDTLIASASDLDLGGKGANQAVMVGRCNVPTVFVAALGDDGAGLAARARLADEAIDLRFLAVVPGATDRSIIFVGDDGANFIVSTNQAAATLSPEFCKPALDQIRPGDLVLLQGNLNFETTAACLKASRARGGWTLVNPAPIAFSYNSLWPFIDYAIVNEVEARELGRNEDEAVAGQNLIGAGAGIVLVTLGERGALVIEAGKKTLIGAPRVSVLDTTGAGDVFCGVVAAGLSRGLGLANSANIAIRAASLSVGRLGTQKSFPTAAEMRELFGS